MFYEIRIVQEYALRFSKTGKSVSREQDADFRFQEMTLGFELMPKADLLEELVKAAATAHCSLIWPASEAYGWIEDAKGRRFFEQKWRATFEPNTNPRLEKIA